MSGVRVERRDHVLITLRSPAAFIWSTFFCRWSSTNGPFFKLRGTVYLRPLRVRRRRIMSSSDFLPLRRGGPPPLPPRGTRGRPPALFPPPPPPGGAAGVIATPRVWGRRPFPRLRAPLPA